MKRPMPYSAGARTLGEKLVSGARLERKGVVSWEIDAAGSCENPVGFSQTYRGGSGVAERRRRNRHGDRALFLDGTGRCRQCDACRRYRRAVWRNRCYDELGRASRTWWGTLTMRPEVRSLVTTEAMVASYSSGVDYAALSDADRGQRVGRVFGQRVQQFLKRVRKVSRAKLRYMLVGEQHADGYPHVHILLHEASKPCAKRVLEGAWRDGFSKWRLVQADDNSRLKVSAYITKYMLKSSGARIRASRRYGSTNSVVASGLPAIAASSPTSPEGAGTEGDDPRSVSPHGYGGGAGGGEPPQVGTVLASGRP